MCSSIKISLIIPVFNSEFFLKRCLDSVVNQEFKKIEIIVVNDASKDNSSLIIKDYEARDQRIKSINLDKNMGSGYCRNLAIEKSKGEYIMFLDSDDYLEKNTLSEIYSKTKQQKLCDALLFGFTEIWHDSGVKNLFLPNRVNNIKREDVFTSYLMNKNGVTSFPWSYAFKRKFIVDKCINFSEGVYYEDIEFISKAMYYLESDLAIINNSLYNYQRQKQSVTLNVTKVKIFDRKKAYDQLELFLKRKEVYEQYKKEYNTRFLVYCISNIFHEYLSLDKENVDNDLKKVIKQLRYSKLLFPKSLGLINEGVKKLPKNDKKTESDYLSALHFLNKIHLGRYDEHI